MNDQEFLDFFISERMQLHYASGYPDLTEDELAAALQLEAEYNHALETLPPKTATIIKEFNKNIADKSAKEGIFYYQKGLKDGLLLYKALEKL